MGLSQFVGSSDFLIAPSVVILTSSFFKMSSEWCRNFLHLCLCIFPSGDFLGETPKALKTSAKLCTMESTEFVSGLIPHMLYH